MNINKYKNVLINFGLKENEARVYTSALSLGPTSILTIARETGIRRTTVYEIVKSIIAKGLMTTELKGFKKLYCATHPQNLISIFENKRTQLNDIVPELTNLYRAKSDRESIKIYEGLNAIKSLYREILNFFRIGDFCYVIGDTEKFVKEDPEFFMKYIEDRAKKDIDIKVILTNNKTSYERKKYERNYNAKVKILPKGINPPANFTVTSNIFLTQALDNNSIAITTSNKDIITLQKSLFEMIWGSLAE